MQLEVARGLIAADPGAAEELLERLRVATKSLIAEVRRVVDDLRPRALDQLGLVCAIQENITAFNSSRAADDVTLQVEVHTDGPLGSLPAAVEVAAYRIATEAVTNAARHGAARRCEVSLHVETDALVVEVRDDGIGLPAQYVPGVGLNSMRERAAELGGSFSATRVPEGGTVIKARLPFGEDVSAFAGIQ
jgi:signal transduction histidine kinase